MKTCFKCGLLKELNDFYKHPGMADGHLNKCKECNKRDVTTNRNLKIKYYRQYDRNRGSRQGYEYAKEYRQKYPNKYRAKSIVNRAVRAKKLFSQPCYECGSIDSPHAHHDDYSKPLNIRWLCPPCHSKWHKENGEGLNGD